MCFMKLFTDTSAALIKQVVQTSEAFLATRATGISGEFTFARLCEHTFGHDGGTDRFIT